MLEFVPLIFAIVGLAVVFYMFKAIIVFIGDELANTAEAYNEDTTHISKQLYELNQSLQNQVKAMTIELKQSTSHYRQSVAYVAQEFDKLSDEIRKIKESVERQQELENEIMRLKSILGRKEKKNV